MTRNIQISVCRFKQKQKHCYFFSTLKRVSWSAVFSVSLVNAGQKFNKKLVVLFTKQR
jgi:hypothetical protein